MKNIEKSQIEFQLEVSVEDVALHMDKAAENISKEVDIKGFRKGKVPKDVLEKTVGKQVLFEEAGQFAIDKKYKEFILENKISPIDYPKISVKKMAEGNPILVDVVVAVYPEIKLPDYKKIVKEISSKRKKDVEVTEKEMQESLDYLQSSRAKEEVVSREVKDGDVAEVDFEVRMDGVKIEGGDSKNHPVKVGAKKFIPGFEEELKGMKAGDEKKFSLVSPKDYFKKELAGKKLDFSVKLNRVLEVKLPDLDDEFAKSLGGFTKMEELKKNIKEGVTKEKKEKELSAFRNSLIEGIAKKMNVDLPDVMKDRELAKMIDEMRMNVEQHGLNFESYLLSIKKTEDDLKKDMLPQAELRVKSALAMEEIAKEEKIKVDDKKVTERVNELLARYQDNAKTENKIDPEQLRAYAQMVLANEEVIVFLENIK